MEKPIVFLSHSSKDKVPLAALKDLLDKRAAGSLEFFLSSDGQSIRFGRNWVVRISDALKKSKLMFVFLSPDSADSRWIHFEAGHASALDIQVVPVCLPGMDLNRMFPPLSLLQGFNLHSDEAMGNIARTCNDVFGMRMDEAFGPDDFKMVFAAGGNFQEGFFGEFGWAISDVDIRMEADAPPTVDFNPLPVLEKICKQRNVEPAVVEYSESSGNLSGEIEIPGCVAKTSCDHVYDNKSNHRENRCSVFCDLGSELFESNAELIDQWSIEAVLPKPLNVTLYLRPGISAETTRHKVTSLLHKAGIKPLGNNKLSFRGISFEIQQTAAMSGLQQGYPLIFTKNSGLAKIMFTAVGGIAKQPIGELLKVLFQTGVLSENSM